jgi:serine/threonine protein kinase/WD40 repeat protein
MSEPVFKRIEELFHQAVALPPAERPAFLDTTCAGDTAVRAAVEDLLRHDRDEDPTTTLLMSPVAHEAEELRPGPPPVPGPQAIPGYEILEEVGRGGMGIVYKARQTRSGRLVALKMLLPGSAPDPQMLARFRTEAESLARPSHPNIVPIYDIGEWQGQPYFTMKYVAGPSLAELLGGRAQDPSATAGLMEVVARALHAIHECGLIHRDLKPANILLELDGEASANDQGFSSNRHAPLSRYRPYITDFGLAKDPHSSQRLTRTGITLGTPWYMAPEQARGKREEIGQAADLYALGAILYEMLTGRPPFAAENAADALAQLLHEEPISPAQLRPSLPRDLVTICLKCLEKQPRKRYRSAGALAEDLRRFQAGEPILTRPIGLIERAYRASRRHPLAASLIAAGCLLVIAMLVTGWVRDILLEGALARSTQEGQDERQQIIQLNVRLGITEFEAGNTQTSLLRFTEALRLERAGSDQIRNHRIRIATVLRQCPHLMRFVTLREPVFCLNLTAAGGRALTVDAAQGITVWNLQTGRIVCSRTGYGQVPQYGVFGPEGRFLALISSDGFPSMLDLKRVNELGPREVDKGHVPYRAAHPDARFLPTPRMTAQIWCWDARTGESLTVDWSQTPNRTLSLLSENGRWLFIVTDTRECQLWDATTGKSTGAPFQAPAGVRLGALSLDGSRVSLVDADNVLTVWDVAAGRLLGKPSRTPQGITRLLFSPDAEHLLTAGSDALVEIWKVSTAERAAAWFSPVGALTEIQFSPDGRLVLARGEHGPAWVGDATTGLLLCSHLGDAGRVTAMASSADSKQVVTCSANGLVCFWDLPRGPALGLVRTLPGILWPGPARDGHLPFSIDGRRAVGPAQILKSERTGRLAFSVDGSRVAVFDNEATVRIRNTATGEPLSPPLRHRSALQFAVFSPDGARLATVSVDRSAQVWDVATGEVLTPPLKHGRGIIGIAFAENGDQLVVLHEDGLASTWDLTPEERPIEELDALVKTLAGPGD